MTTLSLNEAAAVLKTTADMPRRIRPGELDRALAPRKGPPPPQKPIKRSKAELAREAARRVIVDEQIRVTRRHHSAKRRATRLRRTPPWADMKAIRAIYAEARRLTRTTGIEHHVDHAIPLQGKRVSGLHVHTNMQILTGDENVRKHNRFEPC